MCLGLVRLGLGTVWWTTIYQPGLRKDMAGKIREIQQARPGGEHEKLLDLVVAEKKGPVAGGK